MSNQRIYKASVYKADDEIFEKFCKSHLIKYKGETENYEIYTEIMISDINIEWAISNLIHELDLSNQLFEEKILALNNVLCRVIYNRDKECIFLVNSNIDKWISIAEKIGLEPLHLTNEIVVEKIKNRELQNLSEIKISTSMNSEINEYILKGENLERFDQFNDKFRNTAYVEMYRRKINLYEVEVISPNIVSISGLCDNINLRKSLSKLIMRG